jgi:rare lipoprotein A
MWTSTTPRVLAWPLVAGLVAILASTACVSRRPVATSAVREQHGYATYVASSFHGRKSASGETFDERRLVAAHRTLPFGSVVRVTNVQNGRAVTVRIVDRGPYGKNHREGTIIDLSRAAARRLRMLDDGQIRARVEVLRLGGGT